MRPRLLDLFCGAGGAAMGYHRAGFDVVGIDINSQPRYPFEFIQADVMQMPLLGVRFDAIHASPPCQAYSTKTKNKAAHPDLYVLVRELLQSTGLPWVIENVPGAPHESGITLCGSMFGLGVRRHRVFESSFPIAPLRCDHASQKAVPRFRVYDHGKWYWSGTVPVYGTGGGKAAGYWPEAMGIDWMLRSEIAEAIPPAYTEWIGARLLESMRAAA